VTDWPEAPVPLTAGAVPAFPPVGTTKTWNDGPDAGAGVHWNAHPMLHVPLPTVKGVLVQLPCDCGVGPRRTWGAPAVVAVVAPGDVEVCVGDVVPDVAGATVVELDALAPGTVVEDAPSAGSAPPPLVDAFGAAWVPPPDHVMSMPSNKHTTPNTRSCHVCHERRSLIPSSPGAGSPVPFSGGRFPGDG